MPDARARVLILSLPSVSARGWKSDLQYDNSIVSGPQDFSSRARIRPAFAITRKKKAVVSESAISSIPDERGDDGAGAAEGHSERRFYLGVVTHTGFSDGEQGGGDFLPISGARVVGPLFGID